MAGIAVMLLRGMEHSPPSLTHKPQQLFDSEEKAITPITEPGFLSWKIYLFYFLLRLPFLCPSLFSFLLSDTRYIQLYDHIFPCSKNDFVGFSLKYISHSAHILYALATYEMLF